MSSLSVFNLNIMHGRNRKSAVFPPFVSRKEIQENFEKIIKCIRKYDPDIITLQEIDEGSIFSGSFNQFEFLKGKLLYPYAYFAPSCTEKFFGKNIFVSGNAIFSRHPLANCKSYLFDFSFPTDRMGFVIADVNLPEGKTLTITSIHLVYLDWTRIHSRMRQLKIVEKAIMERKDSAVIAGDFNCGLKGEETSLRSFVDRLNLQTCEPKNIDKKTYPSWDPRESIDWIFASRGLHIDSYKILEDRVSDHLGILAHISL